MADNHIDLTKRLTARSDPFTSVRTCGSYAAFPDPKIGSPRAF